MGLFILEESNPSILEKREMKKSGKVKNDQSEEVEQTTTVINENGEEQTEQQDVKDVKDDTDSNKREKTPGKLHITQLMVICFIYEFCVRFAQGGYNSRYGIYVTRKFGITSDIFAYVISIHFILSIYYLIQ